MSRETVHSQSYATFFRHFAVLSLPTVVLRKLPIDEWQRDLWCLYLPQSQGCPKGFYKLGKSDLRVETSMAASFSL